MVLVESTINQSGWTPFLHTHTNIYNLKLILIKVPAPEAWEKSYKGRNYSKTQNTRKSFVTVYARNGCINKTGCINVEGRKFLRFLHLDKELQTTKECSVKENPPFPRLSAIIGCQSGSGQPWSFLCTNSKNGLNKFYLCTFVHAHKHTYVCICNNNNQFKRLSTSEWRDALESSRESIRERLDGENGDGKWYNSIWVVIDLKR